MTRLPPVALGALLGLAAAAAFSLELVALQLVGRLGADTGPLAPSLAFLAPLLGVGGGGGVALGALASRLRRRRLPWLLLASAALLPAGAAVAMLSASPGVATGPLLVLALWASVAYSVWAVPPVALAAVVLERLTRQAAFSRPRLEVKP